MAEMDLLLKVWDIAHWELGEAFKGLPDADVWRRPTPNLLSIGEICAHLAYSESHNFALDTTSPLIEKSARYFPYLIAEGMELSMGAEAVYQEVERIHVLAKEKSAGQDLDGITPNRPDWTWRAMLEYMGFHVAYHTGQIYSVRHFFGHETEDN